MLKNEVIKKSNSPYVFNIVVVEKKNGVGESIDKLYMNYRPLNKIIISNRYSLFNINEICNRF